MKFKPMLTKTLINTAVVFSITSSAMLSNQLNAANVVTTDQVIQGSQCVGIDCSTSPSFGFDTIRLKENNLRIKFEDSSSTSGSFPSNDWQITANDSSNGGANKFSIDDVTSGKTPFTVEAGAPSHTLYVASEGRIGIGTSTPVVNAHIVEGNSPTLRLEQDGSSGFTPQTWDIAGNETNFFIRDVTNSSDLPFRIEPGAGDDSLTLRASGVGIGTWGPNADLHVVGKVLAGPSDAGAPTSPATFHAYGSDGNTSLAIEETNTTTAPRGLLSMTNNGGSYIAMNNTQTSKAWYMVHQDDSPNGFQIQHTDGGAVFKLTSTGDLEISGTLITAGTTCSATATSNAGCDLVFSKNFQLESIEEHAASMWENKYLPSVGQTIENEPFNLTVKTGGMLNELEKAHIYIEQLNTLVKKKDAELNNLVNNQQYEFNKKLIKLEEKLARLGAQ